MNGRNDQPINLNTYVIKSAFATLFTHPLRVLLNQTAAAGKEIPFHEVYKNTFRFLTRGAVLNFVRCSCVLSGQGLTKDYAEKKLAHEKSIQKGVSLIAPAALGAGVALIFETPLFRRTLFSNAEMQSFAKTLYHLNLAKLYFFRELGFTACIFGSSELSPASKYPLFLSAAWITAIFHKWAAIAATEDILSIKGTLPNFKKDKLSTIAYHIAKGKYTHPTCNIAIQNPANSFELAYNFLSLSCSLRLFLVRAFYLMTLDTMLRKGTALSEKIEKRYLIWNRNRPATASAENEPIPLLRYKK